jgi:hypothetical protein
LMFVYDPERTLLPKEKRPLRNACEISYNLA